MCIGSPDLIGCKFSSSLSVSGNSSMRSSLRPAFVFLHICHCASCRVAVRVSDLVFLRMYASVLQVSAPFWILWSVCGRPFFCSSLRPVYALSCLPTSVQLLYVTVLFGNSLCTIRGLMRSSQLSSTCSVMPLATKNFADNKLAVHPVSGTAVTLNGCIPSFLLSSHNRRAEVMEVFLVPPSIVL